VFLTGGIAAVHMYRPNGHRRLFFLPLRKITGIHPTMSETWWPPPSITDKKRWRIPTCFLVYPSLFPFVFFYLFSALNICISLSTFWSRQSPEAMHTAIVH